MEKQELILRYLRLICDSVEKSARQLDELTKDMADVKERSVNLENSMSLSQAITDKRLVAIEHILETRL